MQPTGVMPDLNDIAAFLDRALATERLAGSGDPAGVGRPSNRPVAVVGLALEPWPGIGAWLAREGVDALIVHRPWRLPGHDVERIGVLAYHLAFDEALTVGHNPRLAAALGLTRLEVLGRKEGRPIGMLGTIEDGSERDQDRFNAKLAAEFGGLDRVVSGDRRGVGRVAVVGAMTTALVEEATRRGADAYVTGQWREPARAAVEATGLSVVAVGHRRSEVWGLRSLAGLLRERWPGLRTVVASG